MIGSVEELRRECDELKNHLDQLNSPVVLCHNDVQYRNMIYSLDEGVLMLMLKCSVKKFKILNATIFYKLTFYLFIDYLL